VGKASDKQTKQTNQEQKEKHSGKNI